MRAVTFVVGFLLLFAGPAFPQDPVQVDPKHYTIEFENDEVRVLRIRYGPGEKSPMHQHPRGVVVAVTDGHFRFTLPDGKTEENEIKAGQTGWAPAVIHAPHNVGDKAAEVILVEFKNKPGR